VFWASVIAGAVMAALSLGVGTNGGVRKGRRLTSERTVRDTVLQTEVLQATPQMAYQISLYHYLIYGQ
jgi:hypothetical protein